MPATAPRDTDIALRAAEQGRLLHAVRFAEAGLLHVAREIEGVAARQRDARRDRPTRFPTAPPFTAEQALDPDFLP